jgi:hypothetical protein
VVIKPPFAKPTGAWKTCAKTRLKNPTKTGNKSSKKRFFMKRDLQTRTGAQLMVWQHNPTDNFDNVIVAWVLLRFSPVINSNFQASLEIGPK